MTTASDSHPPDEPMRDPSPRASALAFNDGVRHGWGAADFLAWVDLHLVRPRRLLLTKGRLTHVRERGIGFVRIGQRPDTGAVRAGLSLELGPLLTAARTRIVDTLRDTVITGSTDFVNGAIYAGWVSRLRGADGRPTWRAMLTDDVDVSDQVLALFAVDAMRALPEYEKTLAVCDVCGAISFPLHGVSRRGCAEHPRGR